jgi:hypothetical protein
MAKMIENSREQVSGQKINLNGPAALIILISYRMKFYGAILLQRKNFGYDFISKEQTAIW